jgi:hypothetical protein
VTRLWQALLTQRGWIVAALVVDLLVTDHRLCATLPEFPERRRLSNGNGELMTSEDHLYLTRRLPLLRLERLRPPRTLFHDLCNRMCGLILHMAPAGLLGEQTQRREPSRRRTTAEKSASTKDGSERNLVRAEDTDAKLPKLSPSRARQRMQDIL